MGEKKGLKVSAQQRGVGNDTSVFWGEMKWTSVIPQLMMEDKCHVALGHTYSVSSYSSCLFSGREEHWFALTQFLCLDYWGGCAMQGSPMTFCKTRHLPVSLKSLNLCPSHRATRWGTRIIAQNSRKHDAWLYHMKVHLDTYFFYPKLHSTCGCPLPWPSGDDSTCGSSSWCAWGMFPRLCRRFGGLRGTQAEALAGLQHPSAPATAACLSAGVQLEWGGWLFGCCWEGTGASSSLKEAVAGQEELSTPRWCVPAVPSRRAQAFPGCSCFCVKAFLSWWRTFLFAVSSCSPTEIVGHPFEAEALHNPDLAFVDACFTGSLSACWMRLDWFGGILLKDEVSLHEHEKQQWVKMFLF